jgi:hypothetical protein
MQQVAEAKIIALAWEKDKRHEAAASLSQMAAELPSAIDCYQPDAELVDSYKASFPGKPSFDEAVFSEVLQLRSWLSAMEAKDLEVLPLVEVAALASLVPISNLKRAGDLRFKTPRELLQRTRLVNELPQRLLGMASDLRRLESQALPTRPYLLAEDARHLDEVNSEGFDAVLTSPPYLNGTNYFRNTRLELWFAGHLRNSSDLRRFRTMAVTAGINDVEAGKQLGPPNAAIAGIAAKVAECAYDRRIPAMILAYFDDMAAIFRGMLKHLHQDSIVAVDIGDSIYNGVHVPTDLMLVDLLGDLGFSLLERTVLRKRRSYNGTPLMQCLLVFRVQNGTIQ